MGWLERATLHIFRTAHTGAYCPLQHSLVDLKSTRLIKPRSCKTDCRRLGSALRAGRECSRGECCRRECSGRKHSGRECDAWDVRGADCGAVVSGIVCPSWPLCGVPRVGDETLDSSSPFHSFTLYIASMPSRASLGVPGGLISWSRTPYTILLKPLLLWSVPIVFVDCSCPVRCPFSLSLYMLFILCRCLYLCTLLYFRLDASESSVRS